MRYSYDTKAIISKMKQYATFFFISLFILVSLLVLKLVIIKNYEQENSKPLPENELGKITIEEKPLQKIDFINEYKVGNLYGNSQNNLEQGNSRISNLVNGKSQLAYDKNTVFRSFFDFDNKQYKLKIEDEISGEVLFEYNLKYKAKSLITLEKYHFFIEENPSGDIMYVVDNYSSIKNITPINTSNRVRFNSVVTDGSKLYFSDGIKLYSSSLFGENVQTVTSMSSNSRIINIKDGFIYTDDGYTTSKLNIKTLKSEIINNHKESNIVLFDDNNLFYMFLDGSIMAYNEKTQKISMKGEGVFFSTLAINAGNLMYFNNDNGYININNKEDTFSTKHKPIVSVYITNNFMYLYDMQGNEEIVKK